MAIQGAGSTGIAGGAPAPASAITAAEAAAREREDRPTSAMKRGREWEADGPSKKVANEETRVRLEDQTARRVTPPNRMPSPGEMQRRGSSEARREDQRRVNESYHPSEAAHHPPTLPSIQHMPQHGTGSSLPPMNEGPAPASNGPQPGAPSVQVQVKEEPARGEQTPAHEPAARKMDVDENYDDDGDDEKRTSTAAKGSPTAGSSSSNGVQTSQSKQESTA